MVDPTPRVVVDSCVIVDALAPTDIDRHRRSVQVLAWHGSRHEIVLPALVLAEICGSGAIRGDHGGGEARAERIATARKWIRDSRYLIADISERIGVRAASLAAEHNLKGADACVLAVALSFGCTRLYTWDNGLLKVGGGLAGLTVEEPDHC